MFYDDDDELKVLKTEVKIRLYESLTMSTLICVADRCQYSIDCCKHINCDYEFSFVFTTKDFWDYFIKHRTTAIDLFVSQRKSIAKQLRNRKKYPRYLKNMLNRKALLWKIRLLSLKRLMKTITVSVEVHLPPIYVIKKSIAVVRCFMK